MKNIIKIVILIVTTISCKAQSPIIDIEDDNGTDSVHGVYYKDTHNQLNPFEGTYIYANGNTSLKIILQKKVMSSMNGYRYEDLIIGEYQHIVNGVEKINTLNKLNINYSNQTNHSIDGNQLLKGTELGCSECTPTEKRLAAGLVDEVANSSARIQLRRVTVNGQAAIELTLYWEMRYRKETDPPSISPSIADGKYVLIKQ
jgi:hypothetical protein